VEVFASGDSQTGAPALTASVGLPERPWPDWLPPEPGGVLVSEPESPADPFLLERGVRCTVAACAEASDRRVALVAHAVKPLSYSEADGELLLHAAEVAVHALVRLAETSQDYKALFDHSADAMLVTEPGGRTLKANPAACALFGMTAQEICARPRDALADPDDPRWADALRRRREQGHVRAELTCLHADGTPIEVEVSSTIYYADGEERTAVSMRDIRERRALEEQLRRSSLEHARLALVDELTDLPNRRSFFATAQQRLQVARETGLALHVLVADVDDLKHTNDTLGHDVGDLLLVDVATVLREHFGREALIARLSGDEFALVVEGASTEEVDRRLEELPTAFDCYRRVHGRPYLVRASVGVSSSGVGRGARAGDAGDAGDAASLDDLLRQADSKMYRVKRRRPRPDHGDGHPAG
jgi:diguanylate cyclase (GGDEF)-like protein/PAS domain S-box-containing protein